MLAQTNKFIFPGAAFPVGLAAVKEFVLGRPPEDSQGRHSGPLWTDSFRYSVQGGATQFTDAVLGPGPSSAHRASVTALFLAPGELERKTSGIPALETKKNRHFTDFLLRSPRSRRLAVIPPTAPPARTPGATDSSTASPSSRSFEEPLQILSGTPSLASPRRASIQECGPTDIELKAVAMLLPEPLPPSITLHLDPMVRTHKTTLKLSNLATCYVLACVLCDAAACGKSWNRRERVGAGYYDGGVFCSSFFFFKTSFDSTRFCVLSTV